MLDFAAPCVEKVLTTLLHRTPPATSTPHTRAFIERNHKVLHEPPFVPRAHRGPRGRPPVAALAGSTLAGQASAATLPHHAPVLPPGLPLTNRHLTIREKANLAVVLQAYHDGEDGPGAGRAADAAAADDHCLRPGASNLDGAQEHVSEPMTTAWSSSSASTSSCPDSRCLAEARAARVYAGTLLVPEAWGASRAPRGLRVSRRRGWEPQPASSSSATSDTGGEHLLAPAVMTDLAAASSPEAATA
jgi:hypothetical protein